MHSVVLKKGCAELAPFPHVVEFALKKNSTIQFDSFKPAASKALRLYYVMEGKFAWFINKQPYILYPGDMAIVLPGQLQGGEKGFLDIGTLAWLHIRLDQLTLAGKMVPGVWSSLSEAESKAIGKNTGTQSGSGSF